MFKVNFFLNPKRQKHTTWRQWIRKIILYLPIRFGLFCGFQNIDYSYVHGQRSRIYLGKNCSTMNTFFNVISGNIIIGDNTLFGHGCMVLTGVHQFFNGVRGDLHNPPITETPSSGRDICIGSGCFIGSGAIILGNVNIGDNVIIGAGAVVAKDIPSNCIAAGIPAKVLRLHAADKRSFNELSRSNEFVS